MNEKIGHFQLNSGRSRLDSEKTKDKNTIKCSFCDFDNNVCDRICSICEGPLPENIKEPLKYDITVKSNLISTSNQKETVKVEPSDDIECRYCNHFNKRGSIRCSICEIEITYSNTHAPAMSNDWLCPSCTFKNKRENKCCEICFTFQVREGREEDIVECDVVEIPPHQTWKCKGCNYANSFDTYICKQCKSYAPFFQKWVCKQCSFFNHKSAQHCDVCKAKKESMDEIDDNQHKQDKERSLNSSWDNLTFDNCIYCNCEINDRDQYMCQSCSKRSWYCNNQFCGNINYKNTEFCGKCELKKDSNITKTNMVDVNNGRTYVKMWQCITCGIFNDGASCVGCKLFRTMAGSSISEKMGVIKDTVSNFIKNRWGGE